MRECFCFGGESKGECEWRSREAILKNCSKFLRTGEYCVVFQCVFTMRVQKTGEAAMFWHFNYLFHDIFVAGP